MKTQLTKVRIAFPALFEAKAVNPGDAPRFGASFPIEPGSENAKKLEAAMAAAAQAKWGEKAPTILKKLIEEGRVCFQKKEKTSQDGDVVNGFEKMYFLNASNKSRPLVLNRDKSPLTAEDGVIYGGCYVNVSIEMWAQDNTYGRRINATLRGVQFNKNGDAFGGGTPASADEFEELSMDEEEDTDELA